MADRKIDGNDGAGNVEAPDQIWASNRTNGNCVVSFTSRSEEYSIEYIRAVVAASQLAAANARADRARDAALVEAADRLKSVYRVSMTRIGGVDVYGSDAGSPASCYHTILALRDKPASAQTVQEAAKVVLDWWENVDQDDPTIPTAINVVEIMGDDQKTVDQFHAALRAIAASEA